MDVIVEELTKIWPDSKGDGIKALDALSHRFRSGRLSCILGPSGCGKSTLIQIVGGLERATSGTVRVENSNPAGARLGFCHGLAEPQPLSLAQRHR